jgi:hypothetical protein
MFGIKVGVKGYENRNGNKCYVPTRLVSKIRVREEKQ